MSVGVLPPLARAITQAGWGRRARLTIYPAWPAGVDSSGIG